MYKNFETPILFIIYNRPEITEVVFEKIRSIKPKYLFIAADGPKHEIPGDDLKCNQARDIIINGIDWDCNVHKLLRSKNLGCGIAVSEALTWFFENVEEGIILEDDCLPNTSFFHFCSVLLEYHRKNEKIMLIGGTNILNIDQKLKTDYFYSAHIHVWGWASWRRTWKKYDYHLRNIGNEKIQQALKRYFNTKTEIKYWLDIFEMSKMCKLNTWDYQLAFTIWNSCGYCIIPKFNLVSNIGFGENATHTTFKDSWLSNLKTTEFEFPIIHPSRIKRNSAIDKLISKKTCDI